MAKLIRMPEISANVTSAVINVWSKSEGDAVNVNDCLAEIESDKAVIEFSAEDAGTLGKILVSAGQEVAVGTPIGVLYENGETAADIGALLGDINVIDTTASDSRRTQSADSSALDIELVPFRKSGVSVQTSTRTFVSPLARRLAGQRGVSLEGLRGSGPNGRIVRRDVESAAAAPAANSATVIASSETSVTTASGYTEVAHSNIRRTIARRLSESKATIPHFYLAVTCLMDRLLSLRTEINGASSCKISVNDFVVRAVAMALREVPAANVGWTETAMRQYTQADISVAVSTDFGLITPVVRAADRKPLAVISAEIADLATRARASQLRPDEYQGGSFSVSSLGMYGVSEFSAIINPPQAAILAVGATQQVPVAEEGVVKAALVMRCTLSVDHRAIDGALAARWLATFKRLIENPLLMLV